MLSWFEKNEVLLAVLGLAGLLFLVGSLVAIPIVIMGMREDYFVRIGAGNLRQGLLRRIGQVLKNVIGVAMVLVGLVLLLLPGQGILMILIGLGLVDFPGKHRLQLRLVLQPGVRRSISWIRRLTGRPELIIPEEPAEKTTA